MNITKIINRLGTKTRRAIAVGTLLTAPLAGHAQSLKATQTLHSTTSTVSRISDTANKGLRALHSPITSGLKASVREEKIFINGQQKEALILREGWKDASHKAYTKIVSSNGDGISDAQIIDHYANGQKVKTEIYSDFHPEKNRYDKTTKSYYGKLETYDANGNKREFVGVGSNNWEEIPANAQVSDSLPPFFNDENTLAQNNSELKNVIFYSPSESKVYIGIEGKVKSIVKDSNGNTIFYWREGDKEIARVYTEEGNLEKEVHINHNNGKALFMKKLEYNGDIWEYYYDNNGNVVSSLTKDAKGNININTRHEYYLGKRTKTIYNYYDKGKLNYRSVTEYQEDGFREKKVTDLFLASNRVVVKENGSNRTTTITETTNGKITKVIDQSKNEQGYVEKEYVQDGSGHFKRLTSYENFDKDGNPLKKEEATDKSPKKIFERKDGYNQKGWVEKKK